MCWGRALRGIYSAALTSTYPSNVSYTYLRHIPLYPISTRMETFSERDLLPRQLPGDTVLDHLLELHHG